MFTVDVKQQCNNNKNATMQHFLKIAYKNFFVIFLVVKELTQFAKIYNRGQNMMDAGDLQPFQ